MKRTSLFFSIFGMLFFSRCGSNDVQLPDQELMGKVAGEDWEIKFANGFLVSSDLRYRVQFLSTLEPGHDPCTIPSPGHPFVSMEVPLETGSFFVPFPNVGQSPRFHVTNSHALVATSGFLEVFDIDGRRILGYLQAQLDDENTVEGSFEVLICN